MFSLSYSGSIADRKGNYTKSRTMAEFYKHNKNYDQKKIPNSKPFQQIIPKKQDFPGLEQVFPKKYQDAQENEEIDFEILKQFEQGLIESEWLYYQCINFNNSPFFEYELGDVDGMIQAEHEGFFSGETVESWYWEDEEY